MVALIGRRLISPRAGLLAGLLFAVLPETTRYGQEARSYALVTALAATASYLLVRVLDAGAGPAAAQRRPARRRWLLGYGLVLAALGLVNFFALTLIPAHALTVWLARRKDRGRARPAAVPAGVPPPGPPATARPGRCWPSGWLWPPPPCWRQPRWPGSPGGSGARRDG